MASSLSASARAPFEKQEYVGAVTLLHFSRDGSLLFAGVGATLYVYEVVSGKLVTSYNVFSRGILHGLDYVPRDRASNFAVFFGQKRLQCVRDLPETTAGALSQSHDLQRVGKAKAYADWIFDVQILSGQAQVDDAFPRIAVGLAHNYIQLWDPNQDTLLRTVICSERCILYSLAFHGRTEENLLIASGTVFQQVLLWNIDRDKARADPKQRLHGHDGVIFKLEWSKDARMLASVSDDRTLQLWMPNSASRESMDVDREGGSDTLQRLSQHWDSRFRAWGHTARLWDVRFCGDRVVTTSEDGMCKVWDLSGECVATLQGHVGKHVWRVAIHPSERMLATGGGDGAVKLWDLHQQTTSTIESAGANCEFVRLGEEYSGTINVPKKKTASLSIRDIALTQKGTGRDTRGFVAVEDGRIYELHLNETSTSSLIFSIAEKLSISTTPNISSFTLDADEHVLLVGDASGSVLIIDIENFNVFVHWKAHSSRVMKVWWNKSAHGTLFTCGADGSVREWQIGDGKPMLVGSYCGPAKCATSALMVLDTSTTRNVICGDARANIFGFTRPLGENIGLELSEAPATPSFVLRGVHGRDMVSTLLMRGRMVYSGGHDGYICTFLLDDAHVDDHVSLCYVGRESIKAITTVKQLWVNESNDLMVFGFHATFAVLYNLSAQYRLFNIECGGWRRPHALLSTMVESQSIPCCTFVFTPVTKSSDLLVQIHSSSPSYSSGFAKASLHHQFHGRTATCVCPLGKNRLVTAGEDNALKLHRRLPVDVADGIMNVERWSCLSTGVAHTTTIRALGSFYLVSQRAHIVVSGGGKQRLNVWRVRDDLDVIEFLCGQEMSEADQDHRILGLSSFTLGPEDRFHVIAACNSEGCIQILLLDLGESISSPPRLHEVGQCSSSKKPILSCDSLQFNEHGLLVVGSTDGMINVWDLSGILSTIQESLGSTDASIVQQLQPVYKYLAHDMGTNCLTVSHVASSPSTFTIVSGGDDQNLRLRELRLDSMEVVRDVRARNASGSALKAVGTSREGRFVYCAGYDQRVSQWSLLDGESLQWQSAVFTECADIADLAILSGENDDTVVVVGQGLQNVQFT